MATTNTVPFDQMPGLVWFDGKLVSNPDAMIHVLTHGLHYASSVFEGERAYNGVIFKSNEHSERLKKSAYILDFEIPILGCRDQCRERPVDRKECDAECLRPRDFLARLRTARRVGDE